MSTLSPDTLPAAEAIQIALLRRAPAWRKLELVGQLSATVQTLLLSGLRQRNPQSTPNELRRLLADLLLGPELAARVYGTRSEELHDGC
jgi:hypothetical protein